MGANSPQGFRFPPKQLAGHVHNMGSTGIGTQLLNHATGLTGQTLIHRQEGGTKSSLTQGLDNPVAIAQ
jgi:hypothetical protein